MEVQEDVRRESESDISSAHSPTEVHSQATSASRYQVSCFGGRGGAVEISRWSPGKIALVILTYLAKVGSPDLCRWGIGVLYEWICVAAQPIPLPISQNWFQLDEDACSRKVNTSRDHNCFVHVGGRNPSYTDTTGRGCRFALTSDLVAVSHRHLSPFLKHVKGGGGGHVAASGN